MKQLNLLSTSSSQTTQTAQTLAKYLKPGDILCLSGDLGSGKTTFVKGLAQRLKVKSSQVSSPTFVLMNIYEGSLPLYHFDLYRLDDIKEMRAIGCEEFFYGQGISVIEWADKLKDLRPREYLDIHFAHQGDNERGIHISAHGKQYDLVMHKVEALVKPLGKR